MADSTELAQRLRAAMQAKDHAAVVSLFSPGIVLHSPILGTRFEGVGAVSDLYEGIMEGFTDYRYTRELAGDGEYTLGFEGTVRGRRLEGVDIVRAGDDGLIAEMTIMIRPLGGLIAFLVEIGPHVARRRGRAHALVMRLMGPPLPLIAKLVDWVAPKLVTIRRG